MPRFPVVVLLLVSCFRVYGWGREGHRLVALIAEAQLTTAARAQVVAILGPDRSMASIAAWADEVRRPGSPSEQWHFVNIPLARKHLDMAQDCPGNQCVVGKITALRRTLQATSASPTERREVLMYLIHFVGDLHQPLHSSTDSDRGGNMLAVHFDGRQATLHSVWDSGLLGRMGPEDELAADLLQEAAWYADKWSKGTPELWADETHLVGRKMVYGKLPKHSAGAPIALSNGYERDAEKVVRRQIEKAGVRLAHILNELWR